MPPKSASAGVGNVSVEPTRQHRAVWISEILHEHWAALGLSNRDFQTLLVLLLHCQQARAVTCYPSQAQLATIMTCSIPTVERSVARLSNAYVNGVPLVRVSWERSPEGGRRRRYDLTGTLVLNPSELAETLPGREGVQRRSNKGGRRSTGDPTPPAGKDTRAAAQISEILHQHREALGLTSRDFETLSVLLLHCRRAGGVVCYPSPARLAERMACSEATVERSVGRLSRARVNGVPLLVVSWERSPEGRRRRYDLTGALVLVQEPEA